MKLETWEDIPMISKLLQFLQRDIWEIELDQLKRWQVWSIKSLRLLMNTGKRFIAHDCFSMASALTFYSLLSIVPVLAAAFVVAKGFGLQENFESALLKRFPEQELVLRKLMEFAHIMLEKTKEGVIGGIGALVLLWSVVKLFNKIEESFNRIFNAEHGRTLSRKFSDYLALILICPLLFILASSLNIYINSQAQAIASYFHMQKTLGPILQFALSLAPYTIIWGLFIFIYLFAPNTKIHLKTGVLSGIYAGSLYLIWQWLYINTQIGASNYGAIYGSFAAIPLFLVWLQISWFIVLAGAEFCASWQWGEAQEYHLPASTISHQHFLLLTLTVAHKIIQNFCEGQRPLSASDLSSSLKISLPLVKNILGKLKEAGILADVNASGDSPPGYVPLCDPKFITIQHIIDRLENHSQHESTEDLILPKTPASQVLAKCLEGFQQANAKSPLNYPLKDIGPLGRKNFSEGPWP